MGALANDGTCVVDEKLIHSLHLDEETLQDVIGRETEEICRREETYRDGRPQAGVAGKVVILVDDGLATGATMRVAATALRHRNPAQIVVAVPVAARQTCLTLLEVADRVVCPSTPAPFVAVGLYYENFDQTSDDEVRRLLAARPGCRA
jgi:putative phosphoribosyl transferase